MNYEFKPSKRMLERLEIARNSSDGEYFYELLFLGEMLVKFLVIEMVSAIDDDRERHRYALEYRLVRADGIGEWSQVLELAVTGTASQHIIPAARNSQRAFTVKLRPDSTEWQRSAIQLLEQVLGNFVEVPDTSSRQVTFQQWMRQFAQLRNRTRGHGAPSGASLSDVCSDLEESLFLVLENAPAFQRPWAYLKQNLSGKYRVSGFGGNRENFVYLTREKDHTIADGTYIFFDEPRVCPLLSTNPELTDFFLPNGNYRNGKFDIISYISDEHRTVSGSNYKHAADALPASETSAGSDLEVINEVFANIPPRPRGYVNRTTLESALVERLVDERHPVITLHGGGGVGKTSMTLEVLHELTMGQNFFAIIWFSARDIDLLQDGPHIVLADVLTKKDIATDFSNLMGVAPDSKSSTERYLTDCLSGQSEDGPFLFVFDNFETIQDPVDLYDFISNAVRLPNKVLVTTRTRDFKGDYPIEVRGMNRSEFDQLVNETVNRLGIRSLIDSNYIEALFEESGGHPYITKVLLGEVSRTRKRASVKPGLASNEALLDALFDRSFESLSTVAQRVFLTLCSWRSLVPRIGLEAVLLRPANERMNVEHALVELEQYSLIERIVAEDSSDEFLTVPLAASSFGKKRLVTSPLKIAVDADVELMRNFGVTTTTDLHQGLRPRMDQLAKSVAQKLESSLDVTQELAILENIARGYPKAWLTLANIQATYQKDAQSTMGSLRRYLESEPSDESSWQWLIGLYKSEGATLAEINARLQLLENTEPSFETISSTASRLNGLLHRREISLDSDERRLVIQKLRDRLEQRHDESDATGFSRLAWLCMHQNDHGAARHWVAEGLKRDPNDVHCLRLQARISGEPNLKLLTYR